MQNSNGPGPLSYVFGVVLGALVLALHQAPRSVITVYVANNGSSSDTHYQASSILLPLATSASTILLIAYLFYLGFALHAARRRGTVSSTERLDALLSSTPVLSSPELAPIPISVQGDV